MSLSPEYVGPTYNRNGCRCGAHRLHRVFRFAWENPSASRKDCAKSLGLSLTNIHGAFHRLRQKDLTKYCPECFSPNLFNGVCHNCGFEPEAPSIPLEIRAEYQSPTNHLHPGNMLGSDPDYFSGKDWTGRTSKLPLSSKRELLATEISRATEDALTSTAKSRVMEELKRYFPEEAISDEAGRLVLKEVIEFRSRYPGLNPKGLAYQISENVLNRLRLLHPRLRELTNLPQGDGT